MTSLSFDDQAFPFIRAFHAQLDRYYLAIFNSHLYLVIMHINRLTRTSK